MKKLYKTSLLTPFLKSTLGYAGKRGVSFWTILDRALAVHGMSTNNFKGCDADKRDIAFNAALLFAKKMGLVDAEKRYVPKSFHHGVDVRSDDFLSTYEWRRVRMEAIKKYGAKCQCCGATPATGAIIHVDHIKPRRIYPELALDVNNLQILCDVCNHGKGNWDMTDWRDDVIQVE